MDAFIRDLPKVELHLHVEGTLEPELMLALADRNHVDLPFASADDVRAAYEFDSLQSFLDLYYLGASVLRTERDFYDLTWAYIMRAQRDNVQHAEIFFDPQTHTARGVPFDTVVTGIEGALTDAELQLGITSQLIMCFLRDRPPEEAMATLEMALPFQEWIIGVGLDSAEMGNPPERFGEVFARARAEGFRAVAHAGEEGPPEYIAQALDTLHAERIDHGVRCVEDDALVARLRRAKVPLTVCPLSNVKLRVFADLASHSLKRLLELGLRATINSDDPAYFGGYIADNFVAAHRALALTRDEIVLLASNAVEAAFVDDPRRQELRRELRRYAERR